MSLAVPPRVKIQATLIPLRETEEGAIVLLSNISKPSNPVADAKKLQNLSRVFSGRRIEDNRSRKQVFEGAADVWGRLRHAIRVGDWFDRQVMQRGRRDAELPSRPRSYGRSLVGSLEAEFNGAASAQAKWDPWLPVAHVAAGFRITMWDTGRLSYFSQIHPSSSFCVERLDNLLNDLSWLEAAIQEGASRLVHSRFFGFQPSAECRLFYLAPSDSQKSPPD